MGKILCWLRLHRWNKWSGVPATRDDSGWYSAQIRQCANCWLLDVRGLGNGYTFNLRSLREVVREHIKDLEGCADVIAESEFATALDVTRQEMLQAAKDLSEAVEADESAFEGRRQRKSRPPAAKPETKTE